MRILVTGATGFLGSSIAQDLKKPQVGKSYAVHGWNGRQDGDFLKLEDRHQIVARIRPNMVIHCAWHSTDQQSYENSEAHAQWVKATSDFAIQCQQSGIHFVHMGSAVDDFRFSSKHLENSEYATSKQRLRQITFSEIQFNNRFTWISPQYIFSESAMRPRLMRDLLISGNPESFKPRNPLEVHDYIHLGDVTAAVRVVLHQRIYGAVYVGTGSLFTNEDFIAAAKYSLGFVSDCPNITPLKGTLSPVVLQSAGWIPEKTRLFFGLN